MADAIEDNVDLQNALRLGGDNFTEEKEVDTGPLYRKFHGSRIPVSKAAGSLWRSRIDQAKSARADIEDAWSEAIRYYENDQMCHRSGTKNDRGGSRHTRLLSDNWTETENVVFSNAVTMLPLLYAKNPAVEVTATNPEVNEDFAKAAEKIINALLNMKEAPGLNIKSKARRGVLAAYLTNTAYLKLDWVDKEDSSEAAIDELAELSTKLENAKTQNEIREIEGKITALEAKVDLLSPAGPKVKLLSGFRVFVDPAAMEPDHSDATWMGEYDYIPTTLLNAVYGKEQDGKIVSVYEPTHVLRAGENLTSIEDEVNNFTLIQPDKTLEAKTYGYKNEAAFCAAQFTKVWYIWDKTTRRVMLFADNNWKWPLWVWDDPLKLLNFFPYYRLWFHETPEGSQPKGEVTYYLDQQDSINDINSQIKQARDWVRRNVLFNKEAIQQEDVEQVLKGPDGTARGVSIPEGTKLDDHIYSFVPPAMAYPELFSTDSRFQAINRLTGINDAQRGAQFKTNTTNDAVETYNKNVDIRVDEKIDAIEDWLGNFAWGLLQLIVQKWTKDDIAEIVGDSCAQYWTQFTDPRELRKAANLRVVGGSTDKPTSQAKKKQALEIGQVVGQFAAQVPAAGVVILKVLERAFGTEMVITQEDWDMIFQSLQQAQQPQGQGGTEGQQGQGQDQQAQVQQLIEQLPEEGKQALQQLIEQGMSPSQALEQVVQATQQAQSSQPVQ